MRVRDCMSILSFQKQNAKYLIVEKANKGIYRITSDVVLGRLAIPKELKIEPRISESGGKANEYGIFNSTGALIGILEINPI